MKVLLSGASGFIGAHALDALLERGHEVHALARRAGTKREGVTWHELDLLAPDSFATLATEMRASHLLHLAWYAVLDCAGERALDRRFSEIAARLR